jgi:hypothetical protein
MNNENQSKPLFRLYRHRRCKSSSDAKSNQMNEVPTGVMSNPPPIVNDDAAIEILGARKRFLRLMFKCQSKTSIGPPSDPIALQTAISSSPSTTNARPEISAELDDGEIQDSPTRKVRIGVISRPSLGSDCIVSSEAPASKTFRRQPQSSSIGAKSILDVRKSLKEMETQLIAATTNGHRIARQKVMHVLLSVTDKENDDDGESLRKELGKLMQKEKTERHQIAIASNPLLIQEDTAGPVDDNMALPPTANKENIPLNISLSNGKKSAKDSDQDIEMALDDLQWTGQHYRSSVFLRSFSTSLTSPFM